MMVTKLKINIISRDIVETVEKKQELPERKDYNMRTCAWILANFIVNPKGEIHARKVKTADKYDGKYTNILFNQKGYTALAKELIDYIKKTGKLPPHLGKDMIRTRVYIFGFANIVKYYFENKKFPSAQRFDKGVFNPKPKCSSPYISSPHWTNQGAGFLGQINSSNCGPHSVRQALKKFGVDISESRLASWAGTVIGSGTGHDGINTAIAKAAKEAGIKIDVEWVNFSDLGNNAADCFKALGELLCQKDVAAFLHILYSGAGEYYDPSDECGHYEYLNKVNTSTNYVQALNSLGYRDGNGYYGHIQDRTFSLQQRYISGISQKSVCILRKR